MTEIYSPPNSTLGGGGQPHNVLKIFIGIVLSVFTASIFLLLGEFTTKLSETFQSFGAELPLLTKLAISTIPFYIWAASFGGALIAALVISSVLKKGFSTIFKLVVWYFVCSLVLVVASFVAMYLPVFTVGQTV